VSAAPSSAVPSVGSILASFLLLARPLVSIVADVNEAMFSETLANKSAANSDRLMAMMAMTARYRHMVFVCAFIRSRGRRRTLRCRRSRLWHSPKSFWPQLG